MSGSYDDIINLPHHVSSTRQRMSMIDRAAQFSPFAALTGYDAAIRETGRITDAPIELDVDGTAMLNEKIRLLAERLSGYPEVTITHFVPDERKSGGAYIHSAGRVRKIDPYEKTIIMADGTVICFSHILDIAGEIFQHEV